jgi:NAD(P)-dependent dehydrogenase (short-subunit alcohol dehydrogenase family)
VSSTANEFSGAAVAIIGGHLGSGPAVVRAFAERGARILVGELAHHKLSEAERAACAPDIATASVDVADTASIARFYDQCEQQLGGLAICVIVAPPVKTKNALDIPPEEYRRVVDQELIGPMQCILEAGRRMAAKGFGRIISFSSMSGKAGVHKHVAPYAAAKGGLITFSRVVAAELAPTGVTVNVIATSLFDVQVAGIADKTEVLKGIPVGRVGRSEEAAHAVLYLASKDGGYVTGEALNLSGGRFMD